MKNQSTMPRRIPSFRPTRPVQNAYTWQALQRAVIAEKTKGKSYRRISHELFEDRVNFGVVQRIVKGIEPKSARIRAALHLVALAPAETCPTCGKVHVSKRCPLKRGRGPRDLFDIPIRVLRLMILFREPLSPTPPK